MKRTGCYMISFAVIVMLAVSAQGGVPLRIVTFDVMNMEEGSAYMPWTSRRTLLLYIIGLVCLCLNTGEVFSATTLYSGNP